MSAAPVPVTEALANALRMHELGVAVQPCHVEIRPSDSKKLLSGLVEDWQSHGVDRDAILRAFGRGANAYLIACGPSKLVVADLDVKGSANGIASWGSRPAGGVIVRTQSGGLHHYFRNDAEIGCPASGLPGVDIKGIGGGVFGPGSLDGAYSIESWQPLTPWSEVGLVLPEKPKPAPPMPSNWRPAEFFCEKTPSGANEAINSMLEEITEKAKAGLASGSASWGGDFHERLLRITKAMGGYVGSGYLSWEQAEQRCYDAFHAAGATPTRDEIDVITSGLDLGSQDPIWVRRSDPPPVDEPRPLDIHGVEPDVTGFAARLIDAADLDELADPQPLIADWLYRDTTARLVGQPGSYKSFVALDMACCVALGRDWHGSATTASAVLYVVGEGLSGYKRRIKAWCVANGVDTEALRGRLLLTKGSILIGSPEWFALAAWVTDHQVALVVLDTQAKATAGYDENSNTDQGKLFAHLDALRGATGGTMLLLHHTGHPGSDAGERGRGASAWRAAVDTELLLTKTGERSAVLRNDRQKEAESGQEVVITMTTCEQSLCVQVSHTATKVRHDTKRDTDRETRQRIKTAIAELIDAGDAATSANIAATMHMRKAEVIRLLTQMSVGHDRELVEVDGPRRSKAYFIKDQTVTPVVENFGSRAVDDQKSGNPFT